MNYKLHILVVDDDRRMTKTTVDILKVKGYSADTAYSGPEALEKIATFDYDCILTDIRMPGMDGVELLRTIRENQPGLPVVLMTAYANDALVQQGIAEGAVAALTKPLDLNQLLNFFSSLRKERTICIVDDDLNFCVTLRDILQARGYAVTTVSDPKDIGEKIGEEGQVVLLDMHLGEVDGLDVFKELRARHSQVQVILVTGFKKKTASSVESAIEINAFACLYKPLEIKELIRVINQVYQLELRRWLDQPAIKETDR